jgi:hypothetical protein
LCFYRETRAAPIIPAATRVSEAPPKKAVESVAKEKVVDSRGAFVEAKEEELINSPTCEFIFPKTPRLVLPSSIKLFSL